MIVLDIGIPKLSDIEIQLVDINQSIVLSERRLNASESEGGNNSNFYASANQ